MTPLEILTVARDIVAQDDWWGTRQLCDQDGRVCAMGALVSAVHIGHMPALRSENVNPASGMYPHHVVDCLGAKGDWALADSLATATRLLSRAITDSDVSLIIAEQTIYCFNDGVDYESADKATQADVVQAFDYAIKFAAEV